VEAWDAMRLLHKAIEKGGHLKKLREEQTRRWFWNEVQSVLADEISHNETFEKAARKLEALVIAGKSLPYSAARELFRHIFAA
jgi:putative protein kinase ArgK-like GTPase of G3E family